MIELKNITKAYQLGGQTIRALDNVSLSIADGEYVAIIGPSGSGKSTLMNVLGCLDSPTSGTYVLNGQDVSRLRDDQLADARNRHIGFVFQRFNLMGRMSAMRNVEMPARYGGANSTVRHERAVEALTAVGLADRMGHTPVELSGGQQQRVAIARALVNQPSILLADEPTGALDSKTGKDILDLFEALHRERDMTLIVVTHDPTVAHRADRVISIRDGRIESDIGMGHERANGHTEVRANGHAAEAALAPVAVAAAHGLAGAPAPEAVIARDGAAGGSAPEPAAPPPATAAVQPAGRMPGKALWARGLIAVAAAVIVNVALGLAIGAMLPFAGRLPMFAPGTIALFTALFGLLGVAAFAIINRVARRPIRLFRWVSAGALLLSFVPNVALMSNPALLRQVQAAGGGTAPEGLGRGSGQVAGNGQTAALPGQSNSQTSGQQAGQQGARGTRGVPGLGPLGTAFSGNGANASQRAAGAGILAIPMLALMALHVTAFGIVVGALTRRPRGQTGGAKLDPSGLT